VPRKSVTLSQLRRQLALELRASEVVVFRLLASLGAGARGARRSLTRRRYAKWRFCLENHHPAAALTTLPPQPSVLGGRFTPTTRGVQYLWTPDAERLAVAGIEPSIRSRGDDPPAEHDAQYHRARAD
jgi:hypothetical protein